MTVEVIKLTKKNVPDEEVIAINRDNECLVGYINHFLEGGFVCENDEFRLTGVTHFMKKPKIW